MLFLLLLIWTPKVTPAWSPTFLPWRFATPGAPKEMAQESTVTPKIFKHCWVSQDSTFEGAVLWIYVLICLFKNLLLSWYIHPPIVPVLSPWFGNRLGSTSGCCDLFGKCHHHINSQQWLSTYFMQAVVSVLHVFTHLIPTTPLQGGSSPCQVLRDDMSKVAQLGTGKAKVADSRAQCGTGDGLSWWDTDAILKRLGKLSPRKPPLWQTLFQNTLVECLHCVGSCREAGSVSNVDPGEGRCCLERE